VTGDFGADDVELITYSDETEYVIKYVDSSMYILKVKDNHSFSMINGSLTFSSSDDNKLEQSFAAVEDGSLNLKNVVLHFESTMNWFIYVTRGEVIVNNITIKDEGVDMTTGEILWVNSIIEINGSEPVVVKFLSSTVENCHYKGIVPTGSLPSTNSSIISTLEQPPPTSSIKIYINDSVFTNNNFDLSKYGSSICRFYSVSSDSGFILHFFFLFKFFL
jgi:hypothetical protein